MKALVVFQLLKSTYKANGFKAIGFTLPQPARSLHSGRERTVALRGEVVEVEHVLNPC